MTVAEIKRANFDLTPEQDAAISNLRHVLAASSTKDTVLRAVQISSLLVNEMRRGNRLYIGRSAELAARLVLPELEAILLPQWQWLVEPPASMEKTIVDQGAQIAGKYNLA